MNKYNEPSEELFGKIMQRIREEQHRLILKRRIAIFSIGLVGSAMAFIPTLRMVATGLVESGFSEFVSLLFSDLGTVLSNWQNFLFALMESFPVISIAAFLTTIFVFLQSLKFLARDTKFVLASFKTH